MTAWTIQQLKPVRRGSLELETDPTLEWRDLEAYGNFPTSLAAARAYIEDHEPSWRGMPDSLVRRQWAAYRRSLGLRTIRSFPKES